MSPGPAEEDLKIIFRDDLPPNSNELTKEEDHDSREYHGEFVRFTHGVGDRNDLQDE